MLVAPPVIPRMINNSAAPATTIAAFGNMGSADAPAALFTGAGSKSGPVVVTPAQEKKAGPVHISSGVIAGLLIAPIHPIYPPIAKAAHVDGTVIVEALISKSGAIEGLHVLSGPAMLQSAAVEAIRNAHYKPFQLNGSPTEVETTITVNFRIGG